MPQSAPELPTAPVRVAAVQATPAVLDLQEGLARTATHVAEAAARGARIVAFPETWLPGYPIWVDTAPGVALWDHGPARALHAELLEQCVVVPGPATAALGAMAREHGVVLVVGVQERAGGTIHNALLTFTPDGALAVHHRKLLPTHGERLVWGPGDGAGLRAVDTPFGRVGGLICWEHWLPLARQTMHAEHEFVHVAQWPGVKETHRLASRHHAFEGRCFVLAVGAVLRRRELPSRPLLDTVPGAPDDLLLVGGSTIYGPEGETLAGPAGAEETILLADCDPARVREALLTLDVTGHYARPDVFALRVDRRRHPAVAGPDGTDG